MKNKTCVFNGHSGSGKSTLLNSIDSSLNIKTAPISSSNLTGQHTTTFSKMFDLKNGSKIIDTPGIKGFGLYNFDAAQLKDCTAIDLEFFQKFQLFINEGQVRVGAGISFAKLLEKIVPAGFFLPVAPGTKNITVG